MLGHIKTLFKILDRKQWIGFATCVFLMLIGAVLEVMGVSMMVPLSTVILDPTSVSDNKILQVLSNLIRVDDDRQLIMYLLVVMIAIYAVKTVYSIFLNYFQYKFIFNNQQRTQNKYLNIYLNKDYEFFLFSTSSQLVQLISSDIPYLYAMLNALLSFLTEACIVFSLVLLMIIASPIPTLLLIVLMSLVTVLVNKLFQNRLIGAGKYYREGSEGLNRIILQAISGIKEVKIFKKEAFFSEKADEYGKMYSGAVRKKLLFTSAPKMIIEGSCVIVVMACGLIYIGLGNEIDLIIPVASAMALAIVRLLPGISRMNVYLNEMVYYIPSLNEVSKLKSESDIINKCKIPCDNMEYGDVKQWDITNLCYSYPNTSRKILNDASIQIKKGETIGIIGETGSGKSTFADVLLGLLKPQNIHIKADGADVEYTFWGKDIGYIPQSVSIIDGSVKENVAFGINKKDIDNERLDKAIQEAQLTKMISEMPEGLETQVGERGVRISGGQRQRIGIARALYLEPQILVFDEATSALDNETESMVMESINAMRGKHTMIMIAHRLSTLKQCDEIYKVENGKILHVDKEKLFEQI